MKNFLENGAEMQYNKRVRKSVYKGKVHGCFTTALYPVKGGYGAMPYEVISTKENKYVSPGCPVYLEKSAVLYHTDTKKRYVQLRLVNASRAVLTACTVQVTAFRAEQQISAQQDYCYSDLHVKRRESFGQKDLIVLSSEEEICDVRGVVKEAVFGREKHCYDVSVPQIERQKTEPAEAVCGKELTQAVKRILQYSDDELYLPAEMENGVWQCICRTLNREEVCCACGQKKQAVFSLLGDGTKEAVAKKAEAYRKQKEKAQKNKRKWIGRLAVLFFALSAALGAADLCYRATDKYNAFWRDSSKAYDTAKDQQMREYTQVQEKAFIERQSALKKFLLANKEKLGGEIVGFSECTNNIHIDNFNEETWQIKQNEEDRSKVDLYRYSIDRGYRYVDTIPGSVSESDAAWDRDANGLSGDTITAAGGKLLMQIPAKNTDKGKTPASLLIYDPEQGQESWRTVAEYPYGENGCYLSSVNESFLFPGYFVFQICTAQKDSYVPDTKLQALNWKENRLEEADFGFSGQLPEKITPSDTDNAFDWISYASVGNHLVEAHHTGNSADITVEIIRGEHKGMKETYSAHTVVDLLYLKAAQLGDSSGYIGAYIDGKRTAAKRMETGILLCAALGLLALGCAFLIGRKGGKENGYTSSDGIDIG